MVTALLAVLTVVVPVLVASRLRLAARALTILSPEPTKVMVSPVAALPLLMVVVEMELMVWLLTPGAASARVTVMAPVEMLLRSPLRLVMVNSAAVAVVSCSPSARAAAFTVMVSPAAP